RVVAGTVTALRPGRLPLVAAEPPRPRARRAEGRTGEHGDARFLQKALSYRPLVEAGPLDVGEGVERPLRALTAHSWHRVERVNDYVAPPLELGDHSLDCGLRLRRLEGLHSGHLGEG